MRLNARKPDRPGVVLLAVLVVVALLTLAVYHYSEWMLAEYQAAASAERAAQARAFADSGIHYTAALLADPAAFGDGGNPYDNPQLFHGIPVGSEEVPSLAGRFSLIAPQEGGGLRHGVVDESGKINLNALLKFDSSGKVALGILMGLPGMTDEIANALIDWLDTDEEPRANGAESDYYAALNPPYLAKNGPIDSLDELLLVRGITPDLLYGDDRNRNGVLDAEEQGGELGLGWSAFLTFYGREQNIDSEGNPRIYVNDKDLQALYDNLNQAVGPELANYLVAYRLYGPASASSQKKSGGATRSSGSMSRGQLNFSGGRPRNLSSLFELINTTVAIPGPNADSEPTYYASPLNSAGAQRQLLPVLLDKATTIRDAEIPGRVNINTAPEAVLRALPGLADADVQSILSHRPQLTAGQGLDPIYQSPAWLVTEANLPVSTVRTIERYVTTRSQVYRVQSIGYFDLGGPSARIEAVIDTGGGRPRIVYWRDLTELGRGYDTTGMPR